LNEAITVNHSFITEQENPNASKTVEQIPSTISITLSNRSANLSVDESGKSTTFDNAELSSRQNLEPENSTNKSNHFQVIPVCQLVTENGKQLELKHNEDPNVFVTENPQSDMP
jgi:uncharacterized protein YccT (UPF0319 family)